MFQDVPSAMAQVEWIHPEKKDRLWRNGHLVLGLTGGIGSGKSTVASILRQAASEHHLIVVDADQVARDVLHSDAMRHNLVGLFGPEILIDGDVSRERIAAIVFRDDAKRAGLNALIHPEVRKRFREIVAGLLPGQMFVYDVPLLYEAGLDAGTDFDLIVVVSAPEDVRIARSSARSGWSLDEFKRRESTQMALSEKEKRADVLIRNTGPLEELKKAVIGLIHEVEQMRRSEL